MVAILSISLVVRVAICILLWEVLMRASSCMATLFFVVSRATGKKERWVIILSRITGERSPIVPVKIIASIPFKETICFAISSAMLLVK